MPGSLFASPTTRLPLPPRPRAMAAVASLALLLAAAPLPVRAKTDSYALDPVHTRIAFQVSHAGFSNPIGTFSGTTGTLEFDDKNWAGAKLSVHVPIDSLDIGNANWKQKILDRTFFDVKKFPEASFVSTQVSPTGEKTADVTGDLTLHGVTHPVTLKVTLNALKRHPLTFKHTAGFSATATLSRKDFGMDAWKNVVGDEVRLIIESEALRSHDDQSAPAKPSDEQPEQPEQPNPPTEPPADAHSQ